MACEVAVSVLEHGDDGVRLGVHDDGDGGAALGSLRDLPVREGSRVRALQLRARDDDGGGEPDGRCGGGGDDGADAQPLRVCSHEPRACSSRRRPSLLLTFFRSSYRPAALLSSCLLYHPFRSELLACRRLVHLAVVKGYCETACVFHWPDDRRGE